MIGNFSKRAVAFLTVTVSALWLGVPAFALNPATGDETTQLLLPIMGGLLAVSVILVIVYAVLSAKKKK
ncbi:hypothetical protein V6615_03400 [Oscillospiraceae bacterium PP1C4]